MLPTFAFALALLPVLSLAQVYTVSVGTNVQTFTLPPFAQPSSPSGTVVATATATATATDTATAVGTSTATATATNPATTINTIAVPPPKNATGTSTLAPFTGAASNPRDSSLAVALAGLAGLAALGIVYG